MVSDFDVVFRGCVSVVDTEYDRGTNITPVEAVIEAVAAAAGVEATELPPLFEAINTDALNQIFQDRSDEDPSETILSFYYDSWIVFVCSDGQIRICDPAQKTDPAPVFNEFRT